MGNYKMNKLSLAAAGILTLGFAVQIGATYQQTEKIGHQIAQQTTVIKHALATEKHQELAFQNEIKNMSKAIIAWENEYNQPVVEEFKITSVDTDGYVRGEQPVGGEGIYYPQSFFVDKVGALAVGDEIEITWDRKAYDNGDWENVLQIEKIIE
jgi:hypothetical protein